MMALITTFTTVPLITLIYPQKYYSKTKLADSNPPPMSVSSSQSILPHILLCLPNIPSVPSMLALTHHLTPNITALRLIALGERTSTVMRAAEHSQTCQIDGVLSLFRAFARLTKRCIVTKLVVATESDFARLVVENIGPNVQWVVVPEILTQSSTFFSPTGTKLYLRGELGEEIAEISPCSVVVFLDRGFGLISEDEVVEPLKVGIVFCGGLDDREAVNFVLCLDSLGLEVIVYRLRLDRDQVKPGSIITSLDLEDQKDEAVLQALKASKLSVQIEDLNTPNLKHVSESNFENSVFALLKQNLEINFGSKDLIVIGKFSYQSLSFNKASTTVDSRNFKSWVESEAFLSSIVFVSKTNSSSSKTEEFV
ncbi:K(+)/H(+) antiporter [Nowakowskiella sp. JEL0078]|nr:K(+)/H(+) antiporter [Nowakowskiella sp. JEL0078]